MDDTKLANLIIRHTLASQGYGKQLADKIVRLLNSADEDLMEKIAARYALIAKNGFDRGEATTKRFEDMLDQVRAINSTVYSKLADTARDDLTDIASHEVDFTSKAMEASGFIDKTATIPDANFIKNLVETSPIPVDNNGVALLQPWVDGLEDGRMRRLEGAMRLGLLQGETTDDLVKRIAGTKAAAYQDGILNISRQSAQTFALTANSSVQNNARLETFKGMRTIGFVEWSAILDNRTSAICQSLSGKIFPIDGAHPTPPAHPRCRSLLIPRRNDTDPPKHKPYKQWLKEQPDDVQDDVLGKTRGEAYRAGTITTDDLYRDNGSFKTLDELKLADKSILSETLVEPIDIKEIDEREKKYVVETGIETGTEHLVAYDTRTGEILERKEGERSFVAFSPALNAAISNPENSITLHHNHPSSSSLSYPDMQIVSSSPGASGIWAHAHNGSSFYAEKGADPLKKATVDAIGDSLQKSLQELIYKESLTVEDAGLLYNHLIWLAVDDVGQIVYRAELAGESAKAFARNKALFLSLLENLK